MTNRGSQKRNQRRQNRANRKNNNTPQNDSGAHPLSDSLSEDQTTASFKTDDVEAGTRISEGTPSEEQEAGDGDIILKLFYSGHGGVGEKILSYLDAESLSAAEGVSEEYRQMVMEGLLWKKILERSCLEEYLMRLIALKDGWGPYLFQPKSPSVDFEFYKDLYFRVRGCRQHLIRNWRNEKGVGKSFRFIDVNQNSPCPKGREVSCMEYSSEKLALGFANGVVKILEGPTLKHLLTFKETAGVVCVKFDARVVVTASRDHNLRIWDLRSGKLLKTLFFHSDSVTDLHFNDNWIISCSKDKTLKVWDRIGVAGFVPGMTLVDDLRQGFNCLDFNNQYVVAGSDDSSIRVWKVETWNKFGYLYGHKDSVTCIQMIDKYVVSGSLDGDVRVWYTAFGTCLRVLNHGWSVRCLRTNDDYIVSGDKGLICVWDFKSALSPCVSSSDREQIRLQEITHQSGCIRGVDLDEFKIISFSDHNTVMFSEFLTFTELDG